VGWGVEWEDRVVSSELRAVSCEALLEDRYAKKHSRAEKASQNSIIQKVRRTGRCCSHSQFLFILRNVVFELATAAAALSVSPSIMVTKLMRTTLCYQVYSLPNTWNRTTWIWSLIKCLIHLFLRICRSRNCSSTACKCD
jgi:hypothetical protein